MIPKPTIYILWQPCNILILPYPNLITLNLAERDSKFNLREISNHLICTRNGVRSKKKRLLRKIISNFLLTHQNPIFKSHFSNTRHHLNISGWLNLQNNSKAKPYLNGTYPLIFPYSLRSIPDPRKLETLNTATTLLTALKTCYFTT